MNKDTIKIVGLISTNFLIFGLLGIYFLIPATLGIWGSIGDYSSFTGLVGNVLGINLALYIIFLIGYFILKIVKIYFNFNYLNTYELSKIIYILLFIYILTSFLKWCGQVYGVRIFNCFIYPLFILYPLLVYNINYNYNLKIGIVWCMLEVLQFYILYTNFSPEYPYYVFVNAIFSTFLFIITLPLFLKFLNKYCSFLYWRILFMNKNYLIYSIILWILIIFGFLLMILFYLFI